MSKYWLWRAAAAGVVLALALTRPGAVVAVQGVPYIMQHTV